MKEMKTEKDKAGKVNIVVCRNFKQCMSMGIKILRITGYEAKFYEEEIKEMKYQEG